MDILILAGQFVFIVSVTYSLVLFLAAVYFVIVQAIFYSAKVSTLCDARDEDGDESDSIVLHVIGYVVILACLSVVLVFCWYLFTSWTVYVSGLFLLWAVSCIEVTMIMGWDLTEWPSILRKRFFHPS